MSEWIEYVSRSDMKDVNTADEVIAVVLILAFVVAIYWAGVGIGFGLEWIMKQLKKKGWHK